MRRKNPDKLFDTLGRQIYCYGNMPKACVIIPSEGSLDIEHRVLDDDTGSCIASIVLGSGSDIDPLNVIPTILVREPVRLFAFHHPQTNERPNVRATRLAMACGHFSMRFKGCIVLTLSGDDELFLSAVIAAAHSCDLRLCCRVDDSPLPEWLLGAGRNTYHDAAALQRFANVMQPQQDESGNIPDAEDGADIDCDEAGSQNRAKDTPTTVPLCLVCRRQTSNLCSKCDGVYFCDSNCEDRGWSHECLCNNYRVYTERRSGLAQHKGLGEWSTLLTSRPFQLSENPYNHFLLDEVGISMSEGWWTTELGGWKGGRSQSAQTVNATHRLTFEEGFHPVTIHPAETHLSAEERAACPTNSLGFVRLSSWEEYYQLRQLSCDSPIALLLTFPLTIYYAIVEHGEVPCTVARLLGRALRIHLVGAEKELNFLDLFKEVCFLLPQDFSIELVVVTRSDMLPPSMSSTKQTTIHLLSNLVVKVVHGNYGSESLDPHFDCGSGPPDMVMALNAGIFAYESWRTVVSYLDEHPGVVGVFTDYNEFSGVQCASIGGSQCRESLQMNPFRQPRAMPVFSMNLPQFSNGFMYVFNAQAID